MWFHLVALAGLLSVGLCHVRLTYPSARTWDFDFLDNYRTQGPCGMVATENTPITVFQQNAKITVTWHLAYSHRGGFKLELLDFSSNETNIIANLTANDGNFIMDDAITTTSYEVTLPEQLKGNFTLRLLRHAAEWSLGDGEDYMFWSCADIRIDASSVCNDYTCSERGTCTGSDCQCDSLAIKGDVCQYVDECMGSADCNGHGECWQVSSTTYPRNQCFCEDGYHGKDCKKQNPEDFSFDSFNPDDFFSVQINNDITMYYKVLENKDEVEMRIEASSTTWVAVGWRPHGMDGSCRNFPAQYESGVPEPELESNSGDNGGGDGDVDSESPSQRKRRSLRDTVIPLEESNVGYDDDWNCENDGIWTEPSAEPEGEPEPTPEPESEPSSEPEGEPEPNGGIHPMDCTDIVIGRAKGNLGNVIDYYTRDRSTPRYDEFYGGSQDITAATSKEINGKTIFQFRKKLTTNDRADNNIAFQQGMQIIWAHGQEFGSYVHSPASGLESCEAKHNSDYLFYRKDDIRYHGTHQMQRGLLQNFNFYRDYNEPKEGKCVGNLNQPDGCQGDNCNWRVNWFYNDDNDMIDFTIIAKMSTTGRWTGIGFSIDGQMTGSDAIIGWVTDSGETDIKDFFLGGKSSASVNIDTSQDIQEGATATYQNGFLTLQFQRKRNTGDSSQDLSFEDNCLRILQPVSGGQFSGSPSQHTMNPMVSQKICIETCSSGTLVIPSICLMTAFYIVSKLF